MPKSNRKSKVQTKYNGRQTGNRWLLTCLLVVLALVGLTVWLISRQNSNDLDSFRAQPFNQVRPLARPSVRPGGVSPIDIKRAYNLSGNGSGTVAIIDAFDDPKIETDLVTFSQQYGLASCTTANGCFEKHKMTSNIAASADWSIEMALDVEWAHAIAPSAKILLVEAKSNSGTDLLSAIDYARRRSDVVAVSMSWGGDEFSSEGSYESHFLSSFGASFFASSGDNGHGVSWPAVSANVISVGGTTIVVNAQGQVTSETAWSGSGGGLSSYIRAPAYQTSFSALQTNTKRAVPDVAYDADPASGFPVYDTVKYRGSSGWFIVGGTSAGAPQWAALRSISSNVNNPKLYQDATSNYASFFRDITSGTNGRCGSLCTAKSGFDYVTGLGSPVTVAY